MRTCPLCSHQFSRAKTVEPRSKFHYCPSCNGVIYYDKKKTLGRKQGERIEEEKAAANKIVETFEKRASSVRQAPFYFEGAARVKELAMARNFIAKCRTYISRSSLNGKITASEFALRMVEFVFSDSRWGWMAQVASGLSSIMGVKFASIASDLTRLVSIEITRSEAVSRRMNYRPPVNFSSVTYAVI